MNDFPDNLDERIAEGERKISEARLKTDLSLLKMKLFQMGLNLKTSDYEEYRNLEARIKEMEVSHRQR
jgi:cob(I)alamin adenosyltransferase